MSNEARSLLAALASLPGDALVPVAFVRQHLGGNGEPPATSGDFLDVPAIAQLLDRSPSTARALCASGAIPGAFRMRGREWRARTADVRAFLENEREQHAAKREAARPLRSPRRGRRLDSWRSAVAEGSKS